MRLLVVADDQASFFKLAEGADASKPIQLVPDSSLPTYERAKLARFAPLAGRQASIVDELGIHLVSLDACQETLFINAPNIDALNYSAADNFLVACEKFNVNFPENKNLRIVETQTGRTVAEFVWRMSAKEALKTVKWSPDE